MRSKNIDLWLIGILSLLLFAQGCTASNKVKEASTRQQFVPAQASPKNAEGIYQIRAGDEIEILVWEQPSFNTITTVSRLGKIAMPLIGEIQVSGLTHDQLKHTLTLKLSKYIKEEINMTVSIRSNDSMLVSVFGMVSRPDNYPIVDQTSIFKILSMAGGPSEEANIRSVRIYRNNGESHYATLDLTQYLESGQMNAASQIYPGDVVYVPRKDNAVREMSGFLRDVVLLFGIFRVIN